MSFEHEERVVAGVPAAALWALWADTSTWSEWDPAVDAVDIELREGAEGTMTLTGFEVPLVIESLTPGERYVARLSMGDLLIRVDHVVRDVAQGAEIVVSTVVEGPGAEDVGPLVVRDTPVALAAVVAMAKG